MPPFEKAGLSGAGIHNSIYRGKYLGSAVTDKQWAAIAAGTFDGLYIGDYWTIGGVNWRIAAFDYYYNTGDVLCTTHHVTLVPDTVLYHHVMNDTLTTDGAYAGSKMYSEGLTNAKITIGDAFGESHILNHRMLLYNAVTDGVASAYSWYDSTVELMSERAVIGSIVLSKYSITAESNVQILSGGHAQEKTQFPLFAFCPDRIVVPGVLYYLRDVTSSVRFTGIDGNGITHHASAAAGYAVRPAFSIC